MSGIFLMKSTSFVFRRCLAPIGLLMLLVCPVALPAQNAGAEREEYMSWDDFVEEYVYRVSGEEDGTDVPQFPQWLEERHAEPFNLNTADREELLTLPFLGGEQVDSLLAYRCRHRAFQTLGELMFIPSLTYDDRRWLSLFVYAGDTLRPAVGLKEQLLKGRYEVETRWDVPLYRRAGFGIFSSADLQKYPNRAYLGGRVAGVLRYRYRWRDNLAYGLTMQQDAGEPFVSQGGDFLADYQSFYLFYRSSSPRPFSLWLGDYNVHIGQGLLMGHGLFAGKTQLVGAEPKGRTQVRPHTSTDEDRFFRGAAGKLSLGRAGELLLFASYRRLDGRLDGDTVTSFKTDGYHRTAGDWEKRRTVDCLLTGGHVAVRKDNWQVGAGGMMARYSRIVWPPVREYNRYYLRGRNAAGFQLDYLYRGRRWTLAGEGAADRGLHPATSHTLKLDLSYRVALTFQGRYVSPRYVAPFAEAVMEAGRVQNETGLLAGGKFFILPKTETQVYVDVFRFPHTTYRAKGPSDGMDLYIQNTYTPCRRLGLTLRYHYKTKEQNISGFEDMKEYSDTHRLRMQAAYAAGNLSLRLSADVAVAVRQTVSPSVGKMLSGRVSGKFGRRFSVSGFAAVFFTDDYASRLYAYEPQLRYAGGFPAFAYHGMRYCCVGQWKFSSAVEAGLRYGLLHYFNRDFIGSGTQRINSPSQNDISLQLRCFL